MIRKIIFFFPFQLLLVNLKRNHLLLVFWLILFGITGEILVVKYGIPYLFLAPEYLGQISFLSYFIMGVSIGGFVMSYNITSYILNSLRFPFIAALTQPFLRYCINNSLLPLMFILFYIFKVILYHVESENSSVLDVLIYISGILLGYSVNIIVSLTYFLGTNKNIFKKLGIVAVNSGTPIKSLLLKNGSLYQFIKNRDTWHVESYLYNPFKVRLARDISHYDKKMLKSVFNQNHLNASIFEIVLFLSFLSLGFFSENPIFIIPAGASVILFFTMVLILLSAFYTWFKGWTTVVFVSLFILTNYLSTHQFFSYRNMAYGLNYNTEKADYTLENLNDLRTNKQNIKNDKKNSLSILEKWKSNNSETSKPKLIFINTSGGGSRSTLWTFHTLNYIDSIMNNQLLKKTHLITGSSGGMVGAAYFRELYLRKSTEETIGYSQSESYDRISRDLLNPVALSLATNDLFIRMKKYNNGKYEYTKDRGHAFENQLLINTDYILDKRLMDYEQSEWNAEIPLMIFSPTIINDGRRLLIASQPISFLSDNSVDSRVNSQPITENVEFMKLFKNQDAQNLKFTSAIRMSATFPYIMPRVSLPSKPSINVMDAGMRDNCGALTTFNYIKTFNNWINKNTSGVIIIQLRDKRKERSIKNNPLLSIVESISSPIGSIHGNLFATQDYHLDDLSQHLGHYINQPLDIIDFELENDQENKISLSWHLTTKEKEIILDAIHSKHNRQSINRLQELVIN